MILLPHRMGLLLRAFSSSAAHVVFSCVPLLHALKEHVKRVRRIRWDETLTETEAEQKAHEAYKKWKQEALMQREEEYAYALLCLQYDISKGHCDDSHAERKLWKEWFRRRRVAHEFRHVEGVGQMGLDGEEEQSSKDSYLTYLPCPPENVEAFVRYVREFDCDLELVPRHTKLPVYLLSFADPDMIRKAVSGTNEERRAALMSMNVDHQDYLLALHCDFAYRATRMKNKEVMNEVTKAIKGKEKEFRRVCAAAQKIEELLGPQENWHPAALETDLARTRELTQFFRRLFTPPPFVWSHALKERMLREEWNPEEKELRENLEHDRPMQPGRAFMTHVKTRPFGDVPPPRDGLTVEEFMERIGCADFADKFDTWESLMQAKRDSLKQKDIPVKVRKVIMKWIELYKQGAPLPG